MKFTICLDSSLRNVIIIEWTDTGMQKKAIKFIFLSNGVLKEPELFFFFNLFIWLCQVLVAACNIFNLHCGMQDSQLGHVGSRSLTRDWTRAFGTGSAVLATGPREESELLKVKNCKETPFSLSLPTFPKARHTEQPCSPNEGRGEGEGGRGEWNTGGGGIISSYATLYLTNFNTFTLFRLFLA